MPMHRMLPPRCSDDSIDSTAHRGNPIPASPLPATAAMSASSWTESWTDSWTEADDKERSMHHHTLTAAKYLAAKYLAAKYLAAKRHTARFCARGLLIAGL